ncbi:MAG: hypothetical protein AAGA99_26805 [Actinomycetota bacterium]
MPSARSLLQARFVVPALVAVHALVIAVALTQVDSGDPTGRPPGADEVVVAASDVESTASAVEERPIETVERIGVSDLPLPVPEPTVTIVPLEILTADPTPVVDVEGEDHGPPPTTGAEDHGPPPTTGAEDHGPAVDEAAAPTTAAPAPVEPTDTTEAAATDATTTSAAPDPVADPVDEATDEPTPPGDEPPAEATTTTEVQPPPVEPAADDAESEVVEAAPSEREPSLRDRLRQRAEELGLSWCRWWDC